LEERIQAGSTFGKWSPAARWDTEESVYEAVYDEPQWAWESGAGERDSSN